ncbi:MAG: hypothetical protein HOO96_00020 [Polyangiaceae bacterium]|nr:hypothetical protein [Polyangiaceae bacterium]
MRVGFLAVFGSAVLGCAGGASGGQQSQTLFASESGCPSEKVEVYRVGENIFYLRGCGYKQVYTCVTQNPGSFQQGNTCVPNGPREPLVAASAAPSAPAPIPPVVVAPSAPKIFLVQPPPGASAVASPGGTFAPGTLVHVVASDGQRYAATAEQEAGDQISVLFATGQRQWVPRGSVVRLP